MEDMIGAMAEELSNPISGCLLPMRDFGMWMTSEQKRVFLICRRMLLNAAEADAATQDVFLKAYRALHSQAAELNFDDETGDGAARWLTRIAMNTCLDRLRSNSWKIWQRRPSEKDEEAILRTAVSTEPDAERRVFATEIQQRLERALQKLSPRQRAVFSLRHYEELPLDEIALALKLNRGSVKAHLFRAIAKLRNELRDLYCHRAKPGVAVVTPFLE
jgi:RNA polymerase sigma-70 factor (ECF subfamily)